MRERADAASGDWHPRDDWYAHHEIHYALRASDSSTDADADAAHIVAMSPAVALAVADWLDAVGKHMQDGRAKGNPKAVAVARAYLGRDA